MSLISRIMRLERRAKQARPSCDCKWNGTTPVRLRAECCPAHWTVKCDGVTVPNAYAADTEEGWVWAFAPHPEYGAPYAVGGEVVKVLVRGRVEFCPA